MSLFTGFGSNVLKGITQVSGRLFGVVSKFNTLRGFAITAAIQALLLTFIFKSFLLVLVLSIGMYVALAYVGNTDKSISDDDGRTIISEFKLAVKSFIGKFK